MYVTHGIYDASRLYETYQISVPLLFSTVETGPIIRSTASDANLEYLTLPTALSLSCHSACIFDGNVLLHPLREACGGPNLLSIYSSTANVTELPVPVPQNTSLPGNWKYVGCLAYVGLAFVLNCLCSYCISSFREPGANRTFPYQIILETNNSATNCLSLCSTYGYPAGGMEFADECCMCTSLKIL